MKKSFNKFLIIKSILCVELIIYGSFIYLDFTAKYKPVYSIVLKYIGIWLCFIIALLIGNSGHDNKDTKLLQLAFCFTVLADLFLLVLNYNSLGIFVFCFVQVTYILRHSRGRKQKCGFYKLIISLILIAAVTKLLISYLHLANIAWNNENNIVIILGSMYLFLLSCSLLKAWKTLSGKFYSKYTSFLISIGMTLFFLCDINVGISDIASSVIVNGTHIEYFSGFLVWIFYLPSQVTLALSGYRNLNYSLIK